MTYFLYTGLMTTTVNQWVIISVLSAPVAKDVDELLDNKSCANEESKIDELITVDKDGYGEQDDAGAQDEGVPVDEPALGEDNSQSDV